MLSNPSSARQANARPQETKTPFGIFKSNFRIKDKSGKIDLSFFYIN